MESGTGPVEGSDAAAACIAGHYFVNRKPVFMPS